MAYLEELTIKTHAEGVYNITKEITGAIKRSGVEEGIAVVFCPHTTAGITLNENTDPKNVGHDLLVSLGHAFPSHEEFTHSEGNSYAHVRSSVVGCDVTLIIEDNWPKLGIWQNVYFLEFDGPRKRSFYVKIIKG